MSQKKANYHHGELREALLAAAVAVLEKEGVAGLSLRALAEQLGVSRSAPYRHFEDKAALLASVAEQGFQQFQLTLQQTRTATQLPVLERFKAMGKAYVSFAQTNPTWYQLMFHEADILKNPPPSLKQAANGAFQELVQMLDACQQAGVVKREDVHMQAIFVWSSMHGLSSLLLAGRIPEERAMEDLVDAVELHIFKGVGRTLGFLGL